MVMVHGAWRFMVRKCVRKHARCKRGEKGRIFGGKWIRQRRVMMIWREKIWREKIWRELCLNSKDIGGNSNDTIFYFYTTYRRHHKHTLTTTSSCTPHQSYSLSGHSASQLHRSNHRRPPLAASRASRLHGFRIMKPIRTVSARRRHDDHSRKIW